MKKVIILSDELKKDDFIKLLEKEKSLRTAASIAKNICDDGNTFYNYNSISSKYSKLVEILKPYKSWLQGGSNAKKIVYLSRLYSNNKVNQDKLIKSNLKKHLGDDQNLQVESVDNPNLKDYQDGNIRNRVYSLKSMKELHEMPQYAN